MNSVGIWFDDTIRLSLLDEVLFDEVSILDLNSESSDAIVTSTILSSHGPSKIFTQ
jgi:DNA phosphorothioation-dependent restriction protein DptG